MLGAIAGDTIGSVYEFDSVKHKDFALFTSQSTFTDDSILSIAVAEVMLQRRDQQAGSFATSIKRYAQDYPNPVGGYGMRFNQWAQSDSLSPYNSWGNGSAMRVSAVGFAYNTMDKVTDFEDAIRNTISLGGDTDTIGAITSGLAEAFYGGVPDAIAQETLKRLDDRLRTVTLAFCDQYTGYTVAGNEAAGNEAAEKDTLLPDIG